MRPTKTSRIYNECGYIDIFNGTFHYNFYVRDYIGSIRAVINQYGEIAQMADYYPCGIPTTEYNDLSQNDRLHTGKEFNAFNGYYIYDNAARYLDPILNRFTTIDPLAEKYPSFSPYTACANNTLRIIDPTGMEWMWHDSFTPEEKIEFERIMKQSALFRELYTSMQQSKNVYTITRGPTVAVNNGDNAAGQFDSSNNTITINKNIDGMAYSTLLEEMVHGYQKENQNNMDPISENREYEAKITTAAMLIESNCISSLVIDKFDWSSNFANLKFGTNNHTISPYNPSFPVDYLKSGQKFVRSNQLNNIGNSNYKVPVYGISQTLKKLINNAYNHSKNSNNSINTQLCINS